MRQVRFRSDPFAQIFRPNVRCNERAMSFLPGIMGRFKRVISQVRSILVFRSQQCIAGNGCSLATGVRFRATDGGNIELGDQVAIDRFADVTAKFGSLRIGPRTYIGQFSVICARENITIGADCLIAESVTIRDQDHRFGDGLVVAQAGFSTSPVTIGSNVWVGAKATITKGVSIGDNAIIGANAVVTQDIPANCVAVGIPARVMRTLPDGKAD